MSKKIYINPGHGADGDYGACRLGRREADDALKLCRKVRDLLNVQGVETRMSREVTDGKGPTLNEIVTDANQWKPDLIFICHRNSFNSESAHGVEIYICNISRADRKANAQKILDAAVKASGMSSRGVKQNNSWAMLKKTDAPAYYLEYGFISNADDNAKFDNTLDAASAAIAKALCEIVGVSYQDKPAAPESGTYTVVKGDSPWAIAEKLLGSGTKYKELMAFNGLDANATIYAGQVLKIPGASAPSAPEKSKIEKGDRVRVKSGAKDYNGKSLASFVYKTVYTVLEAPKGDRVVIGLNGVVTAAVHMADLMEA